MALSKFPGPLRVLRSVYWGFSRNRSAAGHRLRGTCRMPWSWLRLWWIRLRHLNRPLVLIGLVENMGDIIAAEPVSRAARREYPDAFIVWISRSNFIELIERFEAVDRAFPVLCLTEWMALLSLHPPCVVWDLHVSDAACSHCKAPLPKYGAAAQITLDTYYDLGNLLSVWCRCAGIEPLNEGPRFEPGAAAARAADDLRLPPRFVVMHCMSNDVNRNWRPEYWNEISSYIHDELGWPIIEVGLVPVTDGARSGRYTDLSNKISLPTMAEVIRRASLFVGLDSGPAHLANAMGTPGVLVFGQYGRWYDYMPYSGAYQTGNADLIRTRGPLRDLSVEAVKAAIGRRLELRPLLDGDVDVIV